MNSDFTCFEVNRTRVSSNELTEIKIKKLMTGKTSRILRGMRISDIINHERIEVSKIPIISFKKTINPFVLEIPNSAILFNPIP